MYSHLESPLSNTYVGLVQELKITVNKVDAAGDRIGRHYNASCAIGARRLHFRVEQASWDPKGLSMAKGGRGINTYPKLVDPKSLEGSPAIYIPAVVTRKVCFFRIWVTTSTT